MTTTNKLRFKQQDGTPYPDWTETTLGDPMLGVSIQTGGKDLQNKVDDGQYPFYVRSANIERIDSYSYDEEAILIPGDGRVGEIYHYVNGKFDCHQRVYKISLNKKDNVNMVYLLYFMQTFFKEQALKYSSKATVDSLRMATFTTFPLSLPCLEEQERIASLLSTVDEMIDTKSQELDLRRTYKQAMMQRLFSQEVRFTQQGGTPYPDWTETTLGAVGEEVSRRNKDNEYTLTLSVNNKLGFISQDEQFDGYRVASKEVLNYKVVFKNEYAFNPSRINVGSIARLIKYDSGIVSPMYLIAKFKNINLVYLDNILKTHVFREYVVNNTAGSVRDSLSINSFFNFPVSLPCLEEQERIASLLSTVDEQVDTTQNELHALQQHKKALMQRVL